MSDSRISLEKLDEKGCEFGRALAYKHDSLCQMMETMANDIKEFRKEISGELKEVNEKIGNIEKTIVKYDTTFKIVTVMISAAVSSIITFVGNLFGVRK